jgi:hypothetical protein
MSEKNKFEYQKPTDYQVEVMKELRAHCEEHHRLIMRLLPVSRYSAIAMTKLEEVSMWENKACVFALAENEGEVHAEEKVADKKERGGPKESEDDNAA